MTEEQKDLIDLLYDNIKSVDTQYESDDNGPDYINCPICSAYERVKRSKGSVIDLATMGTLSHDNTCPYVLISKLKLTMENKDGTI